MSFKVIACQFKLLFYSYVYWIKKLWIYRPLVLILEHFLSKICLPAKKRNHLYLWYFFYFPSSLKRSCVKIQNLNTNIAFIYFHQIYSIAFYWVSFYYIKNYPIKYILIIVSEPEFAFFREVINVGIMKWLKVTLN